MKTNAFDLLNWENAGRGYIYATRFGGRYGQNALDKLMEWSDELFAATMSAYKMEARAICTDLKRTRPQCVEVRAFAPLYRRML